MDALTWGLIAALVVTMAGLTTMIARLSSMGERVEEAEQLVCMIHQDTRWATQPTKETDKFIMRYCAKWGKVWLDGEGIGRKGRHG